MSFDKYQRACLSSCSLLKEVQLLFALGTVLVTTKLVAPISMSRSTHLRCNGVLLYRVEAV